MSNLPTRTELTRVASNIAAVKSGHEKEVADIERQIEKLHADKAAALNLAFVADVKQKAIRAAIRVMEDHGVI